MFYRKVCEYIKSAWKCWYANVYHSKKNLLISPALNVSSFSSTASKSYNARTFLPSEGVLIAVEGYKVDPLGPPLDFD